MADISKDLQQILDAIYGEEVRSSIYHAIELINKISENMITVGNEVTSEDSSTSGYFDESIYINNETWDIWECEEDSNSKYWRKKGNIKGGEGSSLTATSEKTGKTTTVTIKNAETGAVVTTFQILDGADGGGSGDMTKAAYDPDNAVESEGGIPAYVAAHGGGNVGDGKITITQGGVKKGEFTTNQSGDKTIELEGGGEITVDDEINYSSENPVQNKVIGGHLLLKANDTTIAQSFKYGTTSAKAGEHYMYLGNLWKCLVNTTNAPIEGAEWTKDTITGQIEELNSNLGGVKLGIDGDGNYGYYRADDSFVPFKSGGSEPFVIESLTKISEFNLAQYGTKTWIVDRDCPNGISLVTSDVRDDKNISTIRINGEKPTIVNLFNNRGTVSGMSAYNGMIFISQSIKKGDSVYVNPTGGGPIYYTFYGINV